MFLLTSPLTGLLAISLTIIGVASAPAANYFWSNWSDGKPKLTVKNGAEGKFDVTWSGDKGNFVIGKGWNPGSNRLVFFPFCASIHLLPFLPFSPPRGSPSNFHSLLRP